jgi:hypothetical protein
MEADKPKTRTVWKWFVLSAVSWLYPHAIPSDENKLQLYKTIQDKDNLDCGFYMKQCDWIFVPKLLQFIPAKYKLW